MATTGEIAKRLGVDRKTLIDWITHEQLTPFFSESARKEHGSAHRQLTDEDILALNTIRQLRHMDGIADWQEIANYLLTGKRESEFPLHKLTMDTLTVSLPQAEQSAKAAATLAEREAALRRVAELEVYVEALQTKITQLEREKDTEKERLLREMNTLYRQIGALEAEIKLVKEQKGRE